MTALVHGSNLAVDCETCKRAAAAVCWTVSGHALLTDSTSHAARKKAALRWWAGYDTGYLDGKAAATPVVVTPVSKYPIPNDAVWVHPSGNDTNPGTQAKPRATPAWDKPCRIGPGTYNGASWYPPAGTTTSLYVPEGQVAVLEGKSSLRDALRCSGRTNVYGDLRVQNYAPASKENGSNAPVYFGGTSAGSEIDGLSVTGSKMAALGFEVPLTIRSFTAEASGYTPILGTRAKGSVLEQITITGANRGGYTQDGQLAAMKLTSSPGVTIRKFTASDLPGVHALWFDDGCQGFTVEDPDIDGTPVAGRKAMDHGILAEITQGGTIRRGRAKAAGSGCGGVMILDSGGITVDGTDLRSNFVSAWLQQDNRKNNGDSNSVIGTPTENPCLTRDISLLNLTLDGTNQLWAYDDGLKIAAGTDMLKRAAGLWLAPTPTPFRMGDKGSSNTKWLTLAQLTAALGSRASSNYQGTDPAAAAAARVAA